MSRRTAFARLRPRDRRALLLGSVLAIPVLLWSLAVKPYVAALGADRDELASQRDLLARELGAVAAAPRTPAQIANARSALDQERERLFAGDAIAATSAFTNYIKEATDDAGLSLEQLDAREGAPLESGLRDLTLELRAEGDLRGILDALTALESGDRLVRIARLAIEPGPAGPNHGAEALVVSATVHGYAEAEEPNAKGRAP